MQEYARNISLSFQSETDCHRNTIIKKEIKLQFVFLRGVWINRGLFSTSPLCAIELREKF